ncbi:restriction endonuclease [Glycomyces sp. NPDC047010]|uniref:restriction endonuclease n=1 Tax=Glycomyces sp. NPDC047010 TaxID=3155023 RepID=UPI0033E6F822
MQSETHVPTMWELLFPVLDALRRLGGTASNPQIDEAVIASERYSKAQLETVGSNGRELIPYRMAWARSYLKKAGLLESTERAVWTVTERGDAIGVDEMLQLVKAVSDRSRGEEVQKGRSVSIVTVPDDSVDNVEQLAEYLSQWHRLVGESLLDQLLRQPPEFLERVIVDLLAAMGYSGSDGWSKTLGGRSDGGVDGVVIEDQLGLRKLYCQAKRYAKSRPIGPGDIRDFIGALDIKRRHEGVFVTTSRFTDEARQAAELSSKHISLIDGQYLSELMLRYDIAVASHSFVFKQADPEYFN